MASAAAQLIDILSRYAAQQGHRARGGLSTIAGIDFQLRCYLADFTSELARGTHIQEAGAHFLEVFSDYTKTEAKRLVCVQVKRTLSKTTLGQAAEEAVILDEFFDVEAPALHSSSVFEAVGLMGKPDGSAPSWKGVQLRKDLRDRDRRQERFEEMLQAGRFRPPRIEPDPWWRIIAAGWLALDDPFAFAREALEICLRRGMAPEAATQIRDEIAEAFTRRRRGVRFVGHVIADKDVEASVTGSREVLLGQVPTLHHLRDGRLMDRPNQVAAALAELDRHAAERDWRQEPYIYAFWIEGRSGNGKSALLLQLMRQLMRDRSAQVIWLDDASEQLLPLLEAWAQSPVDAVGPCCVFVDDFYAPSKRTGVDFPKILRLLRGHNRTDWPVLVTCGPPEQRQEWKASGDDEAFRTAHWLLPPARADEQNRLRQWFRERTGEEPKTGPAFQEEQGLMLSMVFEMRKGEMYEFGRRFRRRLQDLDLVEALTAPLALNRLYISAPGSWLDERESDALRRLNQDQDFSMLTLGGRAGQYIRVTHPHLSNVIYEAVRERDDAVVRARDLHRAFAKSMQADPATGRLILHRVADNHERLANLDANELAHGMTEAWLNRAATTKAFTGFDVGDLWTDWAVWSARQPLVAGLLGEQPLERARDAPKPDHAYWAISWARLWKCATGHPGLISDAETWLQSQEGLQSLHWSFVWEKLFEYKKSRHQDVLSLAAGAADWLRENEFEPDWNFVLRPLAGMVPERVPWKSALRLLDEFPGNRNWAYVFQVVVENATVFDQDHRQTTLRLGWEWSLLTEAQDIAEWNYVWRKLVELRAGMPKETAKALLRAGYKWLQGREERNGWSHVWEKLVEVRAELPEETAKALLWAGYEWLAGREDREDWNYVWQKLVDVRAELPEEAAGLLLPRGYEWLQGREEREDWSHVWQKLVELRGELPEETKSALLRRGYEWLAGREDRAEWTFVWQNLEACGFRSEHEPLEKLAWRWLERPENADRGGWDKIWEICFKNGSRDDEFLSAGSNWVLGHRALPQTIGLASDLLNAARERDGWSPPRELVGLVRNWLAANPLHPSWTFFWGSLWSIDPSRELLNL